MSGLDWRSLASGRVDHAIWRLRARWIFGPVEADVGRQRLRLILGPGRSGTSWLTRVLSSTSKPTRAILEPLSVMKPPIRFSGAEDPTALPYGRYLSATHPLVLSYLYAANPATDPNRFLPDRKVIRNDVGFDCCLIKEVHSLLATRALLALLRVPTVVITRNPIMVVDSLFSAMGTAVPIWDAELRFMREPAFLTRFYPDRTDQILGAYRELGSLTDRRLRVAVTKAMAVTLLNGMLISIAHESDHVKHVTYEHLCQDPENEFGASARWLGLDDNGSMRDYLERTQVPKDLDDPFSVFRDTKAQPSRRMRSLSESEVVQVEAILNKTNIDWNQ